MDEGVPQGIQRFGGLAIDSEPLLGQRLGILSGNWKYGLISSLHWSFISDTLLTGVVALPGHPLDGLGGRCSPRED